jgi:hypothetical protein
MKSVMITPIRLAAKSLSYWIFKKVVKVTKQNIVR